jgi:hypothetical protein
VDAGAGVATGGGRGWTSGPEWPPTGERERSRLERETRENLCAVQSVPHVGVLLKKEQLVVVGAAG